MYLLFNMLSRDDRGWDGWMTSPTQWTWAWVNFRSWWWIGRPGMLHFVGLQRVGHDWTTELNWTRLKKGMTNHFSILALRTPWTVWKGKKIYDIERWTPGSVQAHWKVPNTLLEISGEITPERMKIWTQSKSNTQLWMWLVIEAKSNAVKSNIAQEPGMLGPWNKANCRWSNRRWQDWMSTF